jgi:hypothetical protein
MISDLYDDVKDENDAFRLEVEDYKTTSPRSGSRMMDSVRNLTKSRRRGKNSERNQELQRRSCPTCPLSMMLSSRK